MDESALIAAARQMGAVTRTPGDIGVVSFVAPEVRKVQERVTLVLDLAGFYQMWHPPLPFGLRETMKGLAPEIDARLIVMKGLRDAGIEVEWPRMPS